LPAQSSTLAETNPACCMDIVGLPHVLQWSNSTGSTSSSSVHHSQELL
jgi:hypothetical protein